MYIYKHLLIFVSVYISMEKYNNQEFLDLVQSSTSYEEVARKLGLKKAHRYLRAKCKDAGMICKYGAINTLDKETLAIYVKESISYAQVLDKLNLAGKGGNYKTLKNAIHQLDLDISHFKGQRWNLGKRYKKTGQYSRNRANKKHLIVERGHLCESCKLDSWLSQPIALELHHIDGDRKNNSTSNLKLLCPNCHAFTDNYRGRNIQKGD